MESIAREMDFEKDIQDINQIPAVAKILEVICSSTGMGYATVARVTPERWIACAVNDQINFGLGIGGELNVETTLCQQVLESREIIAIDHADEDPVYFNHPVPKMYGLQSYIAVPLILNNGDLFGTLCAIDAKPALVNNAKTVNMMKLFSELIAFNLDALNSLTETQMKLQEEQRNAETREQFIAILGHDLRNPVNAISLAAEVIVRKSSDEKNLKLLKIIQDSNNRMKGLIDNMLDFASGRLGGGIKLDYDNAKGLDEILHQVITELKMAYPEKEITADINLNNEVKGDYKRIAQLFSNLLGNAITHGDEHAPVKVSAKADQDRFELCVMNQGRKISPETKKHLFKPFSRGKVHLGQEGLGLGLYIASEIAKAHGGTINVESSDEETCFTLQIPSLIS